MKLKYIALGHRCHISTTLKLNDLRDEAMPFDSIIYSFEGVIDCFQNSFINFFPKQIKCEYITDNSNTNRQLFRGKYGSFTHHNLNDNNVIETFKKRINRLNEYLSVTNDEIIFVRTVMEDNEIELLNNFINTIQNIYPKLKFKLFLVYDNKNLDEVILKYNEYAYIVNSIMTTLDQNAATNPISYYSLFNYLKNIKNFNDIKIDSLYNEANIIFKNDCYKGDAIRPGISPYDVNN
jgi:hypothetical protein